MLVAFSINCMSQNFVYTCGNVTSPFRHVKTNKISVNVLKIYIIKQSHYTNGSNMHKLII